jgi:aspartokinase
MSDSTQATREAVKEAIETDGVIRHGLEMRLINQRALARHIQIITHEKYSFEAILSAIRRHPVKESSARQRRIGQMIQKLSMKNKVIQVTVRNSPEMQIALARFTGEMNYAAGETLWLVSTSETLGITVDSKNEGKLNSKLSKHDILGRWDNLAEIVVEMQGIVNTPGVISAITTQLAVNDVNILGLTTGNDIRERIMMTVDERDLLKAYQALERLSRSK